MRKMILFALAVLCAARCAGAAADPALYRVTGEGGGVCYVFGTIHVGTEKDAEALEKVFAALDECDALLTEVDMARLTGMDIGTLVQASRLLLAPWDSMSARLGEDTVRAVAKATGLPKAALDRYAPVFAMSYLEVAAASEAGLESDWGTDQILYAHAKKMGIANEGMEEVSAQMDAMMSFTDGYVLEAVRAWLEDPEKMRNEVEGLHTLWLNGDEEALTAYVRSIAEDDGEGAAETYETMYASRNRVFARRCADEIASGRTVTVAVGCAHLYGDDGVLRLLEDMGFSVERID